MTEPAGPKTPLEVFGVFVRLGLGLALRPPPWPEAFRKALVEDRRWIAQTEFDEALTLALAVPGARGAHLAMAIGRRAAGYAGLTLAWLGYVLPAAAAALGLAILFPVLDGYLGEAWRHGLVLAAAGLTLNAVVAMARRQAADPLRAGMAIGAGLGLLMARGPVAQILVLAAGALFGLALLRGPAAEHEPAAADPPSRDFWIGVAALALFMILLGGLPFLAGRLGGGHFALASVLYRTGALTFGGEAMNLPLLYREVISRGWLDRESFFAGYGALQGLPGPLTAIGGFAAAAQDLTGGGWTAGLMGLAAIFAPGVLMTLGALPFWPALAQNRGLSGAVAGLGAVAVGSVAAAWWNPLILTAVRAPVDWIMVLAAWLLPWLGRVPPWVVVIGLAAATLILRP